MVNNRKFPIQQTNHLTSETQTGLWNCVYNFKKDGFYKQGNKHEKALLITTQGFTLKLATETKLCSVWLVHEITDGKQTEVGHRKVLRGGLKNKRPEALTLTH